MESVVDLRECEWCHEPYRLSDGRYRYCSDECAEKARRARGGRDMREFDETPQERKRRQHLEDYWQRCMAACKTFKDKKSVEKAQRSRRSK